MTPEAWGFFSVLTTVAAGTLVELVRTRRQITRVATPEAEADDPDDDQGATPLGPLGFRRSVLISLAEIKAAQGDLRRRLDRHLGDHASSDLRRPGRRARE